MASPVLSESKLGLAGEPINPMEKHRSSCSNSRCASNNGLLTVGCGRGLVWWLDRVRQECLLAMLTDYLRGCGSDRVDW